MGKVGESTRGSGWAPAGLGILSGWVMRAATGVDSEAHLCGTPVLREGQGSWQLEGSREKGSSGRAWPGHSASHGVYV